MKLVLVKNLMREPLLNFLLTCNLLWLNRQIQFRQNSYFKLNVVHAKKQTSPIGLTIRFINFKWSLDVNHHQGLPLSKPIPYQYHTDTYW